MSESYAESLCYYPTHKGEFRPLYQYSLAPKYFPHDGEIALRFI